MQHVLHLQGLDVVPAVCDMVELEHHVRVNSSLSGRCETASTELVRAGTLEPGVLSLLRHVADVTHCEGTQADGVVANPHDYTGIEICQGLQCLDDIAEVRSMRPVIRIGTVSKGDSD